MKKLAMLATCAALLLLLPPLPAKAQVVCGSQQCTWTLQVSSVYLAASGPVFLGTFAYANYDTAAHCESAAAGIINNAGLYLPTVCVPTASVPNIHP